MTYHYNGNEVYYLHVPIIEIPRTVEKWKTTMREVEKLLQYTSTNRTLELPNKTTLCDHPRFGCHASFFSDHWVQDYSTIIHR